MNRSRSRIGGPCCAGALVLVAAASGMTPVHGADYGVVEGIVIRVHGEPVAYANVVILRTRSGAQTDETGRFRITAVAAGRWQLQVDGPGVPRLTEWITLAAGDTLRLTLRLPVSVEDRAGLLRDSLIAMGRWPPRLDPDLEARMRRALEVRIFRLDPGGFQHPPPADTTRFVGGWPIVGEVRRPRPLVNALLPALMDTLLYIDKSLGAIKPCGGFQPGIDVRFLGAGPATDLLLCFQCGEFAIRGRDGRAQAGDFGPHAAEFVRFAKAMFPTDPAIQALGRSRAND